MATSLGKLWIHTSFTLLKNWPSVTSCVMVQWLGKYSTQVVCKNIFIRTYNYPCCHHVNGQVKMRLESECWEKIEIFKKEKEKKEEEKQKENELRI